MQHNENYIALSILYNFIESLTSSKDQIKSQIDEIIDKDPRVIYQSKPSIIRALYNKAYANYPELLVQSSKLITVQFNVQNYAYQIKPIVMLIDTGASNGVLKYMAAQKLGLLEFVDSKRKSSGFGVGGYQKCYGFLPYIEMQYKDSAFPTALNVMDMQQGHESLHPFDGILGIDFLTMFNVVIDLSNKVLVFNNHLKIPINVSQ
jgi:hypothetical protein